MRARAGVLLPAVLLFVAGIVTAEEPGPEPIRARALRNFVLDGELDEWPTSRQHWHSLGEPNLILGETSPLSREWAGEADLSGEICVAYSATALLIAGRVRDDVLTLNPSIWWAGDEVEVFLDVDPDDPDEDPRIYDDDDYQMILFPLATGRTWGLAVAGGRRRQGDGGFDGVRTAAKAVEENGEYRGYTFEAEIPFVNFPGLAPREGTRIGFDIALSDADGEYVQKTYMTLSRHADLSARPDRFGQLEFKDPLPTAGASRPATDPGWWVPLAILVGALLAGTLLWRFRKPLFRLADVPVRVKISVIAGLVLLLAGTELLPGLFLSARRDSRREELAEKSARLREILLEARKEQLLGDPETGPEPAEVLGLLTGEDAAPPERFKYRPLWVHEPRIRETITHRTPVIDYARALVPRERARFEAVGQVVARAVSVVHSWRPDPAARLPIERGREVARVRIVLETGERQEVPLRYGIEVFGPTRPEVGEPELAWRDARTGTRADEILLRLPEEAPVIRVEISQELEEGVFVVHGVTLVGGAGATPLAMYSRTLAGVPTNLWRDGPPGSGAMLVPGGKPVDVELIPPLDHVWVIYALETPAFAPAKVPRGRDVVTLCFLDRNGVRSDPFVLKRGLHLDPEFLRASRHSPEFEAREAYRWTPVGGQTRHRDIVEIEVPSDDFATLEATPSAVSENVLLAGVTQGRLIPHSPGSGLEQLVYVPENRTYHLTPEARDAIEGLSLTWYRDARAARTTLQAEGVLGSSLPSGTTRTSLGGDDPVSVGSRRLGDGVLLTSFLDLDAERRDTLEASLPLPDASDVEAVSIWAFYAILALLLLAVLLVLADLLGRLSRIRNKLTLGFAIAALVPLLLFFLGLSGILEREMSRTESGTLLEQVRLVRSKFVEIQEDVRRKARSLLRDGRLLDALARSDPEVYYQQTDSLVREIAATASPFFGPAKVYLEDAFPLPEDPGPRVFPSGVKDHPFLESREPGDDIAYRWSSLTLEGVAAAEVEDGYRRIAVEVPVGPDLLDEFRNRFGRRLDLLLFTVRGYPLAGTLVLDDEYAPSRIADRRDLLTAIDLDRAPVIRTEQLAGATYRVAYEVLRTSKGDPIALLAVALPHREVIAARAEVRNLFLLLGAVILVLEIIVGNILTRRITGPLTSLSRSARAVTRGRLGARVPVTTSDEIGDLTTSFNRMTSELARRIEELSRLNAASRTFSGSLDLSRVLGLAAEAFRDSVPEADRILIALAEESGQTCALGTAEGEPAEVFEAPGEDLVIARCVELEAPEVLASASLRRGAATRRLGSAGALLGIPFGTGPGLRGAVVLAFDEAPPPAGRSDFEFLSTLARQVAVALENARLYQLAIEDQATGLYVHSYFLSRLREETDRSLAGGRPLSVILVSLTDLERLCETYGDPDGDRILSEAARRIRGAAAGLHILARADRVTLEVLLPEADQEAAFAAARQVREALTRTSFPVESEAGRTVALTPAIGLASCPEDAKSAEFLLSEARRALYKAVTDHDGAAAAGATSDLERVQNSIAVTGVRFIFKSEKILELLETVDRIATSEVPILVQGETGVGKEVLAELVHEKSNRRHNPLLKVNCAALPETLLEAELFGHERGAFTGADRLKPGRFELAAGGTIFLDEVGEMPPQVQVKLLRVLQDHVVERLGSTSSLTADVRVIAATNRDLLAEIRRGRFREDLYFRLNVVSLVIPPLRARKEDIPALADFFIEAYRETQETSAEALSAAALDRLFAHSWPGNIRELKNVIQRALVISRGREIQADEIVFADPGASRPAEAPDPPTAPRPRPASPDTRGLNARQVQLLEILSRRESITNRDYSDLVGVSSRTGNRDLNILIERGLIEKVGRRRAAVYRLAP